MGGVATLPRTDTMARKHGIRHTTPGAIAGTAVLVRSFASLDPLHLPATLLRLAGPFLLTTFSKVWVPILG